MNLVGFTLQVRPELVEAYKAHHRLVWPEMQAALHDAGWHNYSLFIRPDGLLFGYFETSESLVTARAEMARTVVNARWQALMAPFFEPPEDAEPGEMPDELMVELELIFHLP